MTKIVFLFFILFIFNKQVVAQKFKEAEVSLNAMVDLYHFTNDSMVSKRNQNKTGIGAEINFDIKAWFQLKNHGLSIAAGLGTSTRHFSMNKYRFVLFPPTSDSFPLKKIRYAISYVNIPLGFSYKLTKSEHKRVQFVTGVSLVSSFKTNSNVYVEVDSSTIVIPAQGISRAERIFKRQLRKYTLKIDPFINMQVHIYKGFGITAGYSLLNFYLISWTKSISKSISAFGANISLFYNPK